MAEASLSGFKANVAYWTKVYARYAALAGAQLIKQRPFHDAKLALEEARDAALEAEDRLAAARSEVFAAEAGLMVIESEGKASASGPGPRPPSAAPQRR